MGCELKLKFLIFQYCKFWSSWSSWSCCYFFFCYVVPYSLRWSNDSEATNVIRVGRGRQVVTTTFGSNLKNKKTDASFAIRERANKNECFFACTVRWVLLVLYHTICNCTLLLVFRLNKIINTVLVLSLVLLVIYFLYLYCFTCTSCG